jgi:hypothetical protein
MFYFLTFPGVIVHEWSHKIFCRISGLMVFKTVYFKFGNPSGYVIHEAPRTYLQSLGVAVGPIIFNSIISLALAYSVYFLKSNSWRLAFLWLSFSLASHAFPSDQDLKGASDDGIAALKRGTSLWPIIGFPFIGLIYLADHLGLTFRIVFALLLVILGLAWSGLLVL